MNKDVNNFNSDYLNMQSNINNSYQPLQNNQNLNNISQNVGYNMNVNQTVQNNQNLNNEGNQQLTNSMNSSNEVKKKKPLKKGLIIGLIIMILLIVVFVIVFFCFSGNGVLNNFNVEKITEEEIEEYDIKSLGRWGNLSLGVSYLIPSAYDFGDFFSFKDYRTQIYLHGHSFAYSDVNRYNIYVEKSLEGKNNLETLPLDINEEKDDDKYIGEFSTSAHGFNEIVLTKDVIIGSLNAIYFESNASNDYYFTFEGLSIVHPYTKFIGYSFEYDGEYYSVYGGIRYNDEEEEKQWKDVLLKRLHFVINSFKKYNGESFYELDNNFDFSSLLSQVSNDNVFNSVGLNEKKFNINVFDGGALANEGDNYTTDKTLKKYDKSLLGSDLSLDNIFNNAIANEQLNFDVYNSDSELVEEKIEVINGMEMKKHVLKNDYWFGSEIYYSYVYTFVVDENPYLFQYALTDVDYDEDKRTEEQKKIYKEESDLLLNTLIRTIKFTESDEIVE